MRASLMIVSRFCLQGKWKTSDEFYAGKVTQFCKELSVCNMENYLRIAKVDEN